ncbi:MAG: methyltransferase domain-containing protein [Actinobacteria bacterium]|nr:methyltransferase domain-containing protein [Actinomycetota bacterium]
MSALLRGRVSLGGRKVRRYRGRQVCADTDLHERAIAHLAARLAPGARVADVAQLVAELGAIGVDRGRIAIALDVVPAAELGATDFDYREVDLFDPAARARFAGEHRGAFDAVVLLEVIEHVRNPWETLEFCRSLLRPGGLLLLSTPNVTSFYSRFRFLTGGRLHQFEPPDLSYGHINPMTALMVETVLGETGFRLLEKAPGPPVPVLVWERNVPTRAGRLLHAAAWLVAAALVPLMRGGDLDGWSLFFLAEAQPRP